MWENLWDSAREWAPALTAAVAGIVIVFVAHRVLRRSQQRAAPDSGGLWRPMFVFILAAMATVAFVLFLPVSDSARGQLLSLLGLLATAAIALSATTFVGNAMAGLMLTSLRNFSLGDFLRVGDHVGRVSEKGLLHTEIQTEDRDLTTLPNLYLITHPTTVVRASGTVISATISLGYDLAPERIERLLTKAAANAGLTDGFVQISDLGDHAVTYRVAGFLSDVKHLLSARSQLRRKILDTLHADNVEIVSPTFMNQRVLADDRVFIPSRVDSGSGHRLVPEAKIFDKAEQAQAKIALENEYEAMGAKIEELHERAKNDPSAEPELTAAEQRRDKLKQLLSTRAESEQQ